MQGQGVKIKNRLIYFKMKATELRIEDKLQSSDIRIGNLVYTRYTDINGVCVVEETIVDSISEHGINSRYTCDLAACPDPNAYEDYWGIPLTEQWLIGWGFVKDGIAYNSPSEEFDIIIHGSEDGIRWTASNVFVGRIGNWDRDGVNYVCMGDCFRYVHQLQNLYHALTGQELISSNPPKK